MSEYLEPQVEQANSAGNGEILVRDITEDYLLQEFVLLAEQGLEFPLTLNIGGGIVSGRVVGGRKYFESLIGAISSTAKEDLGASLRVRFSGFLNIYGNDPHLKPPATFIHMIDAKFWAPDSNTSGPPTIWRGRISAVSGFSLGMLESSNK